MCLFCSGRFGDFKTDMSRRDFVAQATGAVAAAAFATVAGPVSAVAQSRTADILIENAKIVTLDPKAPTAEAIAIAGERIVGVGTRRDLEAMRGPSTRVIDGRGRTLIPGLNDSHTHFIRGGLTYSEELRWDGVPSLADALRMLNDQAQRTPSGHWVQVVGGWTAVQFAEKRLPTMQEIEAASGDVPTFVMHLYERAYINKAGMRLMGITRDTPDPRGARLEKDAGGEPTGVVITTTSILGIVGLWARVPKLPEAEQIISTMHFMREHNRLGITSVVDAGGAGQSYPGNYQAIAKLAADKKLTLRIGYSLFAQTPGKELDDFKSWTGLVKAGEGDDYFRMLGGGEYLVWSAVDGFLTATPPVFPTVMESQLTEVMKLVVAQGWPFRMHLTHDESVRRVLGVIEQVHKEIPVDKLRWAVDHAEGISPESIDRVAKLGGAIAVQNRMSLTGDHYAQKWGLGRASDAPPIGRIKQAGVPFACGTDANRAVSHNPWVAIHWMVTGKTIAGTRLNADRNLLDRTEALRAYTLGGAWLTREEDKKGTLEVGKLADLALLSDDYMSVPEDRISRITAVMTMVGGKVVYGADAFASLAPEPPRLVRDWLPAQKYPGYYQAASREAELRYAAAPPVPQKLRVLRDDGDAWEIGCGCGLM
jgi:predicted amidohydrolase YtcJ